MNEVIGDWLQMQFVCVFFHICRKFEFLISHGGVPTSRRWVAHCSKGFVAHFIHCLAVQKFWKSFKIWQSYRRFKGRNVLRHSVFCIYTVSQKLHHIILTIILSDQTVSIFLAYVCLNKFATKLHQARQYILKDIGIMPCEKQHT